MGLGCPLIETGSQRVNLVALINTCWEVTQLYRASARDSNNLLDQRRRDIADLNHCQVHKTFTCQFFIKLEDFNIGVIYCLGYTISFVKFRFLFVSTVHI